MIPSDKANRLIKIYMYICDMYEQSLKYHCQRYSNNSKPLFSDGEILTIYLFVGHEQKYTRLKDIHNFAKEYLPDWFPGLVSYQTFVYRLNRMAGAVTELSKVQPKMRSRGTRLPMTCFQLPYHLSESLSRHSLVGLTKKQIFKELTSAGLLPD